jgi:5-methylcytosine-specific restriction protein A
MWRAKQKCTWPAGCKKTQQGTRCEAHKRAYEQQRGSAAKRGYGRRWSAYSKGYLALHPFCVDPYRRHPGQRVLATMTDHIKAHKGDERLFWDENNHQALCGGCNSYKAVKFEGGFGV